MKAIISLFILLLISTHSLQSMITSKYINIKQLKKTNFIEKYSANKEDDLQKIIFVSRFIYPPAEDKSNYAYLFYTKEDGQDVVDISDAEDEQEMFELIEKRYRLLHSESTSTDTRECFEEN